MFIALSLFSCTVIQLSFNKFLMPSKGDADNGVITVLSFVSNDCADSNDDLQGGYIVMVTDGSTRCLT